MCVGKDCIYNHYAVSHFAQIPFSNIKIAFDDAAAFDFAENIFEISLTPFRDPTRSNYNPKFDYVKRHELFKNYLDSLKQKIIIGHDTESNITYEGKGNILSLLQYAHAEQALIVCLLDYENISNSLFFQELHTNKNIVICTFMKEDTDWLNVKMTNLVDLEPILRNQLERGRNLKYYYDTTFPNSKKLNKSKRYQRERAWERHYSKNNFFSYDALHYAAMDAIATCRLGDFYLNK